MGRNNANNNKPSSDKILDDAFFHSNKANEICFAVANTNDEIEKVRDFYRGIFDSSTTFVHRLFLPMRGYELWMEKGSRNIREVISSHDGL